LAVEENCISCSLSNGWVDGVIKVQAGSVAVDHNWVEGGVVCGKRDQPVSGLPNNCQSVAVTENRIGTNAALENAGTIGEAYVAGNVIRPSPGGSAKAAKNDSGAEIQKLTDINNDVGNPSAGTPVLQAHAIHGLNSSVADQLSEQINGGHKIMSSFLKDDNAQLIAEQEQGWQSEVSAILSANLGQPFADKFSTAASTNIAYPQGHNAQGGSIYNLIEAKIAVLSLFVNQLRAQSR
jgi:hypothetical protein